MASIINTYKIGSPSAAEAARRCARCCMAVITSLWRMMVLFYNSGYCSAEEWVTSIAWP